MWLPFMHIYLRSGPRTLLSLEVQSYSAALLQLTLVIVIEAGITCCIVDAWQSSDMNRSILLKVVSAGHGPMVLLHKLYISQIFSTSRF
jgi:hypothetical protein